MCMLLCCSQIHYSLIVAKAGARPGGWAAQTTKGPSASEREERGHGKGVCVYATLLQSDTVQPYGRAKGRCEYGGCT